MRVEFSISEDNDRESDYDAVEFTTHHAATIEEWGEAVLDFTRPSIWDSQVILLSAIFELGLFRLSHKTLFVQKNRGRLQALRDELTPLLASCDEHDDANRRDHNAAVLPVAGPAHDQQGSAAV